MNSVLLLFSFSLGGFLLLPEERIESDCESANYKEKKSRRLLGLERHFCGKGRGEEGDFFFYYKKTFGQSLSSERFDGGVETSFCW